MKQTIKSFLALMAGAIAVMMCASCSKENISSAEPGSEIRFVVVDTKAFAETMASTLQTGGFKVAAIYDSDHSAMFNAAVAYDSGSSSFAVPGQHYYFPVSQAMSFYGVYPADGTITVDATTGKATLTYSHDPDDDLITAAVNGVSKSNTPSGSVGLTFGHALSQLSVTAKGEEPTVDYKLMNLTVTAADGGVYDFSDGTWTLNTSAADRVLYDDASGMGVGTSDKTAVGSALSVMPGDVKVRAVWKCYNKGTSIIVNEKDVTIDVTLVKGESTTLDLTLPFNGTGLSFSTTVGAWLPVSSSAVMKYKPETIKARFTVDDNGTPDDPTDDRVVEFAKGNLFWNGEEFSCEANQYDYPTEWNANHVGHLKWASTAADAIKTDTSVPAGSTFFAADGGVFEGFTVLSDTEWDYLFSKAVAKNSSDKNTITIDGKKCLILKPDGFTGTIADSYTAAEWATAEASGLVALPFAGYRSGSSLRSVGSYGSYWSSTPYDSDSAWYAYFDSVGADTRSSARRLGYSVRLVKVVQEKTYRPESVNGVFTVNDSGKKVKFAKGNLYWDGSIFKFENHQYDYPTTWDANHVGHFFWSKDARVAYANDYNAANTLYGITPATTDTFFAADGGAIEGYTVLSKNEWEYLIDNAIAKNEVIIDGKSCTVLKPDGFSGTVADTYTAAEWTTAEASGLVALPFAGHRGGSVYNGGWIDIDGTSFNDVGSEGNYWSSPYSIVAGSAWYSDFESDQAYAGSLGLRLDGYSVRLVSVQ